MTKTETQVPRPSSDLQEPTSLVLHSGSKAGVFFIFIIVTAFTMFGFVVFRLAIANLLGELIIIIDLASVLVLVSGVIIITYLYYTRYVRREITIGRETLVLKVGKREFDFKWNEFTTVALSIAVSTTGIKGYCIRLYRQDLEDDYVELPLYRFPKSTDVFYLRSLLEKIVAGDSYKFEMGI